jgi:hypothetical protein
MGVGHAAVALGASRIIPRVNVGWLVFAALFADFLLGIFALLGLESAQAPSDYASRHYLTFTFPYSHGLLALLLWAALAGLLLSRMRKEDHARVFLVIAALVLSHFVLDAIVHVAGLPLAGENSPKIGLGLWKHIPLELALETLMAIAGIAIYWKITGAARFAVGRWGIAIFMVVLTLLTWTQLFAVTPPTTSQLVPTWIVAPLVFAAIPYAFDRKRVAQTPNP